MRLSVPLTLFVACLLGSPAFAEDQVPDQFDTTDMFAADGLQKAVACMPDTTDAELKRLIQDAGDNRLSIKRPNPATAAGKNYMIVGRKQILCVKISSHGKALLPLSAFDRTIQFPQLPAEDAKKLYTTISLQLAKTGAATVLLVNNLGNATQVSYLFSNPLPTQFYYADAFLKKGDFDEASYANVMHIGDGSSSVTARGQSDHSKWVGGN